MRVRRRPMSLIEPSAVSGRISRRPPRGWLI